MKGKKYRKNPWKTPLFPGKTRGFQFPDSRGKALHGAHGKSRVKWGWMVHGHPSHENHQSVGCNGKIWKNHMVNTPLILVNWDQNYRVMVYGQLFFWSQLLWLEKTGGFYPESHGYTPLSRMFCSSMVSWWIEYPHFQTNHDKPWYICIHNYVENQYGELWRFNRHVL